MLQHTLSSKLAIGVVQVVAGNQSARGPESVRKSYIRF